MCTGAAASASTITNFDTDCDNWWFVNIIFSKIPEEKV
jgi:hypothetical protein